MDKDLWFRVIWVGGLGFRVSLSGFWLKPLSVSRVTLKTPFLLADSSLRRAAIGQGQNENLVSIPASQLFPSSIASRGVLGYTILRTSFARRTHATTPVFTQYKSRRTEGIRDFISEIFDSP
jgi:hypothetical protein